MKCISITGIDKSGKSTLIDKLWHAVDKKYYIDDRDISTWHFFNVLLNRVDKKDTLYNKQYKEKLKAYRQLIDLAVILVVDEDDWINRCKEHKEQCLVGGLSFKDHQNELIRHFEKAKYKNTLMLNTSKSSEDYCLDEILHRLGIHRRK